MSDCSVPNCGRTVVSKGKCSMHYQREHKGMEPHVFTSDNLRPARIHDGDIRLLELVLGHLPAKKAGQP